MMDDIRRAYAVFGLPVGSPYPAVRKRYMSLVKRWHPDRFASDPQGQAEAGERLRVINASYSTLARRLDVPAAKTPRRPGKPVGRRLSREEIDALVAAIGSEGPLDDWFRMFGRVSAPIESVLGALLSRVTSRGSG